MRHNDPDLAKALALFEAELPDDKVLLEAYAVLLALKRITGGSALPRTPKYFAGRSKHPAELPPRSSAVSVDSFVAHHADKHILKMDSLDLPPDSELRQARKFLIKAFESLIPS